MLVLTDFDGTVTQVDVGHLIFQRFSDPGWERAAAAWKRGEISSKARLEAQCRRTAVEPERLEAFALAQPLDPHFPEFAEWCESRGIELAIVSDGLDFYIERILRAHGLDHIQVLANHLEFEEGTGQFIPRFPYFDLGCGQCANCKAYHLQHLADGDEAVFIGNGLSDRCPAAVADHLFAKDDLARYCEQAGIPFEPFRDFGDIQRSMERKVASD